MGAIFSLSSPPLHIQIHIILNQLPPHTAFISRGTSVLTACPYISGFCQSILTATRGIAKVQMNFYYFPTSDIMVPSG